MNALCFVAMSATVFAESRPATIEIFTHRNVPITGTVAAQNAGWVIKMYDLDAPKQVARALSTGLPRNPVQAKTVMKAKINALGMQEIKRRFEAAYQGSFKAFEYQISRYPAIVFDQGRSVIYGVRDVNHALRHYKDWRRGQND